MTSPDENDIELKKQFSDLAYSGLDILILYLHIANKPETPPSLRNYFNDIIEDYLKQRQTSLDEIYDRNFRRYNEADQD